MYIPSFGQFWGGHLQTFVDGFPMIIICNIAISANNYHGKEPTLTITVMEAIIISHVYHSISQLTDWLYTGFVAWDLSRHCVVVITTLVAVGCFVCNKLILKLLKLKEYTKTNYLYTKLRAT